MVDGKLGAEGNSRSQPRSGTNSRPTTGASRPGTQQPPTRVMQPGQGLMHNAKYHHQLQNGFMPLSEPQETVDSRPNSRLQTAQTPLGVLQDTQQNNPLRLDSRLDNSADTKEEGYSTVGSSLVGPASTARCAIDRCGESRCGHRYAEHVTGSMSCSGTPPQLHQPMQAEPQAGYAALHQQHHQQCANPLYANSSHAVALSSSSNVPLALPQRRTHTPLAGQPGHLASQGDSPLYTPRRQAAAAAAPTVAPAGSYAAAAVGTPTFSRSTSSSGYKSLNSMARNSGGGLHPASPRASYGATSRAGTAATADPPRARAGSTRPGSSSPWGAPVWQQQGQGHNQLPSGALSQDPVGPTLAAYLGASHALAKGISRRSTSTSRPGSAASRAATAAAAVPGALAGLSSRNSSRPQQQPRPGSTVSPAAAASLLYTPRLTRPASSSVRRPGSVYRQSQRQQQESAVGPLLSDYFRPPSAAAPGGVGLFGLPGMEPPGVSSSGVPCVRVPSVHASWDASAAGLSTDLSSSNSEQHQLLEEVTHGIPVTETVTTSQPAVAVGGQQQHMEQQAEGDKVIEHEGLHQPSSRGKGPVGGTDGSSCRQEQSQGLDGDGNGKAKLLLWSAAHEIDGRPVTRNGERVRPPSRSLVCNC